MQEISRRQLDRRLDGLRPVMSMLRPPADGWVAALRSAYGMTQADLAARLGVTRQAIGQLEQRESGGSVTLKALQDAARALGGDLVYAIVPNRPISETLERRARDLARQMTASVQHTMRLEDQETDAASDEQTRSLARELLSKPHRLWSIPDES